MFFLPLKIDRRKFRKHGNIEKLSNLQKKIVTTLLKKEMFKNRGLFGGIWKPKNPHSLEHLKYLYSVLYKNQTVTESNKSLLVETLRSIAEILIWGDQNDSTVFDFFLERNMLRYYSNLFVTSKNETTNSPIHQFYEFKVLQNVSKMKKQGLE